MATPTAHTDAQGQNDIDRNVRQYTDLDLFFAKKATSKDISKVTDIQAVKRSVRNLVLLNAYEKPFHPEIASGVRGMLFELTTQDNIVLKDNIKALISSFEPRAKITEILVSDVGNDLNVTMMFTIHNDPSPQELDLVLQRVR